MFQVKWFNKRKGYGFVSGDLFVHHSDIQVSGYKYLKRGEYVIGEVTETGGKKKLSNIRAPMEGGKLMCEVDQDDLGRPDRLASGPEDGEVDREVRMESVPSGEVREVGSAPVREVRSEGSRPVRRDGRGPNRGRRDA